MPEYLYRLDWFAEQRVERPVERPVQESVVHLSVWLVLVLAVPTVLETWWTSASNATTGTCAVMAAAMEGNFRNEIS